MPTLCLFVFFVSLSFLYLVKRRENTHFCRNEQVFAFFLADISMKIGVLRTLAHKSHTLIVFLI